MKQWYLLGVVMLWSCAGLAFPATISWSGAGGNSNFATSDNWVGGTFPTSSDTASFGDVTNQVVNVNGNRTIAAATFNAPDTYTFSGSRLELGGSGGIGLVKDGAGTVVFTNNIRVANGDQTWQINNGTVDVQGTLSNSWYSNLTKTGAGLLILSGDNTFQGPLLINGGTVRLTSNSAMGAANSGNVVASGATLELSGGITVTEGGISLSGIGVGGNGALRNLDGNNTVNAQVTLGADTRIQSDTGTLTLQNQFQANSHDLTLAGNGNIVISPNIWDGGDLTILGSGDHTFGGAVGLGSHLLTVNATGDQTFSAQVTASNFTMTGSGTVTLVGGATINVTNGLVVDGGTTLILNKTNTDALQSNLVINQGTVRLDRDQQIQQSNNVSVTVNGGGLFDLNNHNESIDMIRMTGGTVNTGTGTLTISNTGGTNVITNASSNSATINGHLAFAGPNPIVQVADGTAAVDLNVNATINATNGFNKTGAGVMKINQTLNSGGPVEISQGTLLLGASNIIANNVQIKLSGGTFNTGGFSEGTATTAGLGNLTLTANSTINMGTGNSIINFDSATYTSGTLTVTNWSGAAGGGGTDQIHFNTAPNSSFLANVYWADFGTTGAKMIGNEMVPISGVPIVPEPGTVAGGALLGAFALWRFWRRRMQALSR